MGILAVNDYNNQMLTLDSNSIGSLKKLRVHMSHTIDSQNMSNVKACEVACNYFEPDKTQTTTPNSEVPTLLRKHCIPSGVENLFAGNNKGNVQARRF